MIQVKDLQSFGLVSYEYMITIGQIEETNTQSFNSCCTTTVSRWAGVCLPHLAIEEQSRQLIA